ncbi:MAG: hypothetical protein OCD02_05435 [Spirochaetaceae bacterium]
MKKIMLIVIMFIGFSLYADNNISISVKSNKVTGTINLNPSEYIILNEQFLFLIIESEEYELNFSGYPDGELHDDGDIYYSDKVILQGDLVLKDGIEPGDYKINVILGYQSCDIDGLCNIPVEVSEEILVKKSYGFSPILPILILVIFSFMLLLIVKRKKS